MRPRLLDVFCGAGGGSTGYATAGFEVVGVDIERQVHYPYSFHHADALETLRHLRQGGSFIAHVRGRETTPGEPNRYTLDDFDAIHASPPCQARTTMSNRWRGSGGKADSHENLIGPTRDLLEATCLPYVIENVPGARGDLENPAVLTGEMFGLRVHRPRLFETNWLLLVPPKPEPARDTVGVYGKAHDGRLLWRRKDGSTQHAPASLEEAQAAMGMPWASWRGCAEAIPPAYCELIGHQLMQHLRAKAAA